MVPVIIPAIFIEMGQRIVSQKAKAVDCPV
jgi:hypothetical protein